jgi:hypothetical protein
LATERRDVERRAIAQQEAANLVERASAIPFDQITPDRLQLLAIDPEVACLLPDAQTNLTLAEEPGELPAKRVSVEISWLGAGKRRQLPVRFTTWAFAPRQPPEESQLPAKTAPVEFGPAVLPPAESSPPAGNGPAVLPPVLADEPSVSVGEVTP